MKSKAIRKLLSIMQCRPIHILLNKTFLKNDSNKKQMAIIRLNVSILMQINIELKVKLRMVVITKMETIRTIGINIRMEIAMALSIIIIRMILIKIMLLVKGLDNNLPKTMEYKLDVCRNHFR
jgi:hypothetical protein